MSALPGQPYKYQGIELEKHFGLETYETFYRGLNPQIGRFNSIDPLADMFTHQSPYVSMNNNPALFIDPEGHFQELVHGGEILHGEVMVFQKITRLESGESSITIQMLQEKR